jgi:signal transduction histidine kinase
MINFLGTLFAKLAYWNFPTPLGWGVWLIMLGFEIWLLRQWREYQPSWDKRSWGLFAAGVVLLPFTTLFLGIQISAQSVMPMPDIPAETSGAAMMIFSALPWILGGGMLGPTAGFVLGALTGLLRAPWDTHTLFTALQLGLLGASFSALVRQRYRTFFYRILRQPLFAALILIPLYPILYVPGVYFSVEGPSISARLDFALSNAAPAILAFAGEILFAGLVAQALASMYPAAWGRTQALQPSPAERRIETRFLLGTGTFITLLLLTLLIGDWIVAGNAAQEMIAEWMKNTARMSAESVPFFLETGQNLGIQLASDPQVISDSGDSLSAALGEKIRAMPYFTQLLVIDKTRSFVAEYPPAAEKEHELTQEELAGIDLAFNGVLTQVYTLPPEAGGHAARVSFLIAITDSGGNVVRVLVGRTDLSINPITGPLINSLDSMATLNGEGFLVDENGRIIYHPNAGRIMTAYEGQTSSEPLFYDDTAANGTRELVYYQPVVGRPWAVVLTVPAQQVQRLALNIATPLSAMIFLLAVVALLSLRIGLRVISQSLQTLADEAGRIAQGRLDRPLQTNGVDELGQLRRAFEQMRVSLKARLEELNRLLVVSRGVASTLEMPDAFRPVLDAVLATNASAVQIVLSPEIVPESLIKIPTRFALGESSEKYSHLDEQILEMTREQEKLVLPNLTRSRGGLLLDANFPAPAALLAISLRHKDRYYGVLWAAYDSPRLFNESDIRFISTLAGQAALAAANAHLFLSVEIGRRQLESILASTPDPVLVTDSEDRLLLANPAAWQALGIAADEKQHIPIEEAVSQPALVELLKSDSGEKESAEISLPGGQTYLATASSILAEGQSVGRVCILRDVTRFKELDTLKSEFVATVSHDLRSPLTLMRGYATMLEMVGELNQQQQGYVRKIIAGVENMSRLVNNLLDLGRIEIGVGLQVETIPILDIIERVVSALQLEANQKKITLTVETPDDLPRLIEADQALLHQAIYNLVENAIKYTPEGGKVLVRSYSTDGKITFEIQDTGIGIPPEELPRLFEKFYRGKQREARAQHGTGLGLAIVRSIAERHGGRVWVNSQLGKGSAFFLQIPLRQKRDEA